MYSVANLFFRGIYHVTDPFHPFGGAVDIIVVQQPDGSFKSSPWYVRFGKFQGVLKTNENAVNISVNGVEAKFHMYLDYKGEAYFLTEETNEKSRNESSSQSKGGNLDGNDTSSSDQIPHNDKGGDDKVVIGTNSRSGILGLVFGRKVVKKDNGIEERNVESVDEVEQAEIAAELMEMKWSTNLPTDEVTHHPDSNSSNTHENDLHISETLEGLEDTEIEEGNDVERVDSLEQAEIAAELMEMKWSTNLPTDEVTKMDSLSGSLVLDLENNPKLDEIEVNPKSDSVIKHALKENKDDGMCEGEIRKERVSSYLYCETPKSLPLVDGNLGNVVIETPRLTRAGLEEVQVPSRVDYETKAHFFEVNSRSESIEIAINGNVHDVGLLSYESSGKISTTDVIDYNVKNDIIESHSSLVDRHIVTSNILEAANFEALQLELVTEGMPDENKLEAEYSVWPHGSNIDDLTSPVLLDELISKSSPLSIPIVRQGRSEEIEWRMASLPNFRSHIDDLESAEVFHPLSCSVDSGSKRLEIFKSDTPVSIEHDLESNSAFLDIQHTALHTSSPKDIQRMSSISGIAFPITSGMPSFVRDQSHQPEDMFVGDQVYETLEGQSPRSIVIASGRSWRWPFSFTRSGTIGSVRPELSSSTDSGAGKASEGISYLLTDESGQEVKVSEKKVSFVPTSEELASLNLKEGKNMVTFTYSTVMLRKQQVHARIFLWKWDARIVISDVDGTITKSDVLGQFMPLVGKDWSQTGVAHLFSAIEQNGYQFLFLSARSVSQAYLTRQFIINLKQDGKTLPDGPVVISPDGLFPSLFREVIRRAPHEFKIACLESSKAVLPWGKQSSVSLEKIKELFPPDCQPFYAGFGNRLTDEISYLKVGISRRKIFTINPRGEIAVHHRVDTESYTSLHALVNGMFPAMSAGKEEFGSWQYWRIPLPDLDI